MSALCDVFRTMIERGGTVFDTAPSYGASEEVAGRIARVRSMCSSAGRARDVRSKPGRTGEVSASYVVPETPTCAACGGGA